MIDLHAAVALGTVVVVEHPAGHRLTGTVRGIGSLGICLAVEALAHAPFLTWESGWTLGRPHALPRPRPYPSCGRCKGAGVLGGWQGRCPQCGGTP